MCVLILNTNEHIIRLYMSVSSINALCQHFFFSFFKSFLYGLQIKLVNPCRKGKKLLVLDIDYTLFDHRSTAENPLQLMRPCMLLDFLVSVFYHYPLSTDESLGYLIADLHEFLTAAYAEYDIIIWSATR